MNILQVQMHQQNYGKHLMIKYCLNMDKEDAGCLPIRQQLH